MKAMLLKKTAEIGSRPLSFDEIEIPRPGYGEVLIKVKACGVCRSNLQVIEGERGTPPKLPLVPGHEVVGVVSELGAGVSSLAVGDRVGAQPQFSVDNTCEYCISGRENLCINSKRLGWSIDGGYAEYMIGYAEHLHKIPGNISDLNAAPLFCPGATAYGAVKNAEPFPGKKIAVFGIGGVGHLAIEFAKIAGARVTAVSRNALHTELAERVGADRTIISSEEDPVAAISGSGGVDSSIVFAPSDEAVSQAIRSTKKGGIVVIGVDCNIKDFRFMNGQIIKSTVVGTRNDINRVLELASQGLVKISAKEYKLKDANEALQLLKNNKVEGRIVLTT